MTKVIVKALSKEEVMVRDMQEAFCCQESVFNCKESVCGYHDETALNSMFLRKTRVYYTYEIQLLNVEGLFNMGTRYTNLKEAMKAAREESKYTDDLISLIRRDSEGKLIKEWHFENGIKIDEIDFTKGEWKEFLSGKKSGAVELIKHRRYFLSDFENDECQIDFDLGVIAESEAKKMAEEWTRGDEMFLEEHALKSDHVTMAWHFIDGVTKTVGMAVDIELA